MSEALLGQLSDKFSTTDWFPERPYFIGTVLTSEKMPGDTYHSDSAPIHRLKEKVRARRIS